MAKSESGTPKNINKSKNITEGIRGGVAEAAAIFSEVTLHRLFFSVTIAGYVVIAYSGNIKNKNEWLGYLVFVMITSLMAAVIRIVIPWFRKMEKEGVEESPVKLRERSKGKELKMEVVEW